jgi:DNA-binding winged helix-turn-helix (wHTH) protein
MNAGMSAAPGPREDPRVADPSPFIRFGNFQLDVTSGQLYQDGRVVRIKPQPLKLLHLLASRPGELLTREEIRQVLWGSETYVAFDQGVNTAIRQIREALNDSAERPVFVETVPKRGYRFIAPADHARAVPQAGGKTDLNLQKALWLNIAELRISEMRRQRRRRKILIAGGIAAGLAVAGVSAFLIFG